MELVLLQNDVGAAELDTARNSRLTEPNGHVPVNSPRITVRPFVGLRSRWKRLEMLLLLH